MTRLPERPHLAHLKKQAKELLALYRTGAPQAISRLREALPAARNRSDEAIIALGLRLADAQSCLAREYGFPSWADLRGFVTARDTLADDRDTAILNLFHLVYAGDIAGGTGRARPAVAARILDERPDLAGDDPHVACAVGDLDALRQQTERDPAWVNRAGGPLDLPPLVAVTHSSLVHLPAYRERLHAAAELLLDAGADPNQSVASRWMASPSAANDAFPLSALYGAAGQNHDPKLTRVLLDRGANPNDGESLYHSLENLDCTRLLLAAGARVTGTNALYRSLDLDGAEPLKLLLAHGGDPNEPAPGQPTSDWGTPLLWAIRRRRSREHIAALLDAGADPSAKTPSGIGAYALALQFGLPNVAALLRETGGGSELSQEARFVAACAAGDETTALRLFAERPGVPSVLSEDQLRLLPELAAQGAADAVRLMVRLGWPVGVRGGDWNASALNHAVFRGDAALTRFLLAHGAHWTEEHGFGDTVLGTLSWASCNEPVPDGDWPACADALIAHGLPAAHRDPRGSELLVVQGVSRRFSEDVADVLLAAATSMGN